MTTRIASTNIQNATIELSNMSAAAIAALSSTTPTITQIQITNSSYVVLDDTAVSTSGGYIKITGTNFTAGSQVVIGNVTATSVGFVNSTTLNVQVPAQAAGTYIVYLTTNTGSVAILVNGLTYSGTPTWVTGSTLPNGIQGTALSIQLNATGDAPVTYTLAAGSSLPPGLTLSSGGLISGTVTGLSVQTLYNFTVNAIDAEAQDSPRAFDITILVSDPFFQNVTTLLSASTPTSTFVTDASTNSFYITVNGDTRPNNFGPYTPGYYSNFFDGSGDSLSLAGNTAFTMPGDFTAEAWVFMTAYTGSDFSAIFGFSKDDENTGWNILVTSNGTPHINVNMTYTNVTGTIPLNQWTHVALVRSGSGSGNIKLYINGIASPTTLTTTATATSPSIVMLGNYPGISARAFSGYISNARIVKGTAVYTSNFTPSTIPLTAIANTSLLTCQSNRFIDNSTNNFTITRNGDTAVSGFDPFLPDNNFAGRGSGYFDGTGDFAAISTTANTILTGNSNFTLELWAYVTGTPTLYNSFFGGSTNDLTFAFSSQLSWGIYVAKIGLAPFITTGMDAYNELFNRWNHLAVTKSGNNWNIWVNGVSRAAVTDATTFTNSQKTIGSENGVSLMQGYISNIRYTSAVLYTATFTPPTSPLTAGANTQLLTLQNNQPNNNSMFLDNSSSNLLLTRNGNATQGSFNPYTGSYSMYTNGSNSYGYYAYNSNRALGTGDFSVECWVYVVSQPVNYTRIWGHQGSYGQPGNIGLELAFETVDSQMIFLIAGNSQTYYSASVSTTASDWKNRWIHVLVTRQSGTLRAFLNGVLKSATPGATTNINGGLNTAFGTQANLTPDYTEQYISNFRMCVGSVPTSYQTSSTTPGTTVFTTPTSPLTPTSQGATNVRLLAFQNSSYIDNSPLNSTLITANSPRLQRFSPLSSQVPYTSTSYSVTFDGSGDYIDVVNSSTCSNFGTGDFTVEGWFYFASVAQSILVDFRTGPSDVAGSIYNSGTSIAWYVLGADRIIGGTLQTGQWYHIALSRSGTSTKLFLNGTQVGGTYTDTNNYVGNTNRPRWGHLGDGTGNLPFTGLMSNLRIVKGTAVYTANFTPPTAPLTSIANTSLLTCQNSTIIDNSTNNFTITASGNATPKITNPFGYTDATPAAYTPSAYSGSAYFDGNGDSVSLASNTLLNWGTSNFTIEFWAYDDGSSVNYPGILSTVTGWSSGSISIRYNNIGQAGKFSVHWNPAGDPFMASASTFPSRAWHHVALTRSGNTFTMYVNGAVQATGTSSNSWNLAYGGTSIGFSVWDGALGYYKGYVSDLRLIRNQVLYTGPFVPPTAPLTVNVNTVMLNNMSSAGIYDSAMANNYESVGNSSISTSIKKYGNSSIYFDGTGDYLIAPSSPDFAFGTGDFTIECWLYLTATGADDGVIIEFRSSGTTGNGFVFNTRASGGGYVLNFYTDSAPNLGSTVLSLNTWNHVAVTRSGSTVRLFSNGAVSATITKSNNFTNNINPTIGQSLLYGNSNITGYIDDFRITKGVARYTTTFTPPTSPFLPY